MPNIIYYSCDDFFQTTLDYLYDKHEDKIEDFVYLDESIYSRYDYRSRRYDSSKRLRTIIPHNCDFEFMETIEEQDFVFRIVVEPVKDESENVRTMINGGDGCGAPEDIIMSKLVLSCENKEALIKLIDIAKEFVQEKRQDIRKSTNETIRVFYYKKEYWALLSKLPKRPLDTLYLKKGQKESLTGLVDDFFKKETRDIYLSFGMPYKCVIMLYGAPGTGKTTAITTTASHFDCDIYTIPITKELSDYAMIDAFAGINDKEDKKHIVVIEDIDSIFNAEERKKGDDNNMLTLNTLLNCLDGHTCKEGTLLFLTANDAQVMDKAIVRSCRIDHKIEFDYADKYQIKNIYDTFLPEQSEHFDEFYQYIRKKRVTTAMLQEFLFFNRKCDNILEHMDLLMDIIDKNKPKNLEKKDKDDQENNIYM